MLYSEHLDGLLGKAALAYCQHMYISINIYTYIFGNATQLCYIVLNKMDGLDVLCSLPKNKTKTGWLQTFQDKCTDVKLLHISYL